MSYRLRDNRHPEKGKEHPVKTPNELHRLIFRWLDPFYCCKFLDTRWLAYLTKPDSWKRLDLWQTYLSQQLGYLYQSPNFHVDRHRDQNYSVAKFRRPSVYNLDKGAAHLGYKYRSAYHRSHEYGHEFMVDMGFYAPMYAALKEDPALDIVDTYELMTDHPLFPVDTKMREKPFNFNVGDDIVKLDGRPVVLLRTKGAETQAICIPGIQHENCTKGVNKKDPSVSSVGKHLRHAIAMKKQFEKRYGFDRVILPFTFSSEDGMERARSQMHTAIAYVRDVLKESSRMLIFKVLPHMPTAEDYPKPSPDFFTGPWLTVSGDEFRFDDTAFYV